MKSKLLALLAALLLASVAIVRPAPAMADLIWCWDDPVLVIGSNVVHIDVGVPQDQRGAVIANSLVVMVPTNVTVQLSGVNAANFPMSVTLVQSGAYSGSGPIPVTATALVTGRASLPAAVQARQPSIGLIAQATGLAGTAMTVSFTVQ